MTDREILARTVLCEAGGEGVSGMQAVATVIMNRVEASMGEYGNYNDVRDVVFQPLQFVCARTTLGGQYNSQNLFDLSPEGVHYEVADWAIAGNKLNAIGDALWFYSTDGPCRTNFPNQNGALALKIGGHCFYSPTPSYFRT